MKLMKHSVLGVSLAMVGVACHATDDYNKTLSRVGTQQSTTAYFYVNEAWSQPCVGGIMYIDRSTAAGKGMLAMLLQAKATGATIHWVNYTLGANNICMASLIELN